MSKLLWDQVGERLYQTGVKKGVLYPQSGSAYPSGVAWNGLTGFTESPDGAEATDLYADDIKYLSLRSVENFKATITAYTYPDEFAECNGEASLIPGLKVAQQARKPFGFSCVTTVGNDTEYEDHGYIIHIVYGATASPSEQDHQTINDSPEAIEFSWEIDTIPVTVTGFKPTAHLTIDSTKVTAAQLKAIENVLYGADAQEAQAATYKKATGTFQASGVDYYTKSGTTYTKVNSPSSDAFDTYYVIDQPAQEAVTASSARLPLPDEIVSIMQAAA